MARGIYPDEATALRVIADDPESFTRAMRQSNRKYGPKRKPKSRAKLYSRTRDAAGYVTPAPRRRTYRPGVNHTKARVNPFAPQRPTPKPAS